MGRWSRGGVATIAQRERQNVYSFSNANEMKQCRRSLRGRCIRQQREIMLRKWVSRYNEDDVRLYDQKGYPKHCKQARHGAQSAGPCPANVQATLRGHSGKANLAYWGERQPSICQDWYFSFQRDTFFSHSNLPTSVAMVLTLSFVTIHLCLSSIWACTASNEDIANACCKSSGRTVLALLRPAPELILWVYQSSLFAVF